MHRARLLVIKAHTDLEHAHRKCIVITSFLLGLYDRQLASSLAVVKIQTIADSERLAAEGEAMRRDQLPRRSTSNFLSEGACALQSYDPDEPSDAESLTEEGEELTSALRTINYRKAFNPIGKPSERRKANSTTRCYGCGQYGYFKSECPRPNHHWAQTLHLKGSARMLALHGNHFVRDCLSLRAAQQANARSGQV